MEETGRHLSYLDGWRGWAIVCVLAGHFFLEGYLPALAGFGVQLFFVLTGRLMAEILFVREAALGRFYVRRMSRVVPALYCFIVVTAIVFSNAPGGYPVGIKAVAAAATFTINYAMVYSHPVLLFDHLWSLCVEEHGYVLLSVMAVMARRNTRIGATLLAFVAVLAFLNGVIRNDLLLQDTLTVVWRSDVAVGQIATSASLFLLLRDRNFSPYLSPTLLLTGSLLSLCAETILVSYAASTVLLAGAIATLNQAAPFLRNALSTALIAKMGQYSFSIYLWQQPFYKLYRYDVAPIYVLLPAAILTGLVSFYFVERPARTAINIYYDKTYARSASSRLSSDV